MSRKKKPELAIYHVIRNNGCWNGCVSTNVVATSNEEAMAIAYPETKTESIASLSKRGIDICAFKMDAEKLLMQLRIQNQKDYNVELKFKVTENKKEE